MTFSIHRSEKKQEGTFFFFPHLPLNCGCCFTDRSLAGSLGRSFIGLLVQLHTSRCQQKGGEGFAELGGSWQDQDCLCVTPAAVWDDVSADPHPERPGSCFWVSYFCWAHSCSCCFSAPGCGCEGLCNSLVAEILQGLYEQGALQEKEGWGLFFPFLYK